MKILKVEASPTGQWTYEISEDGVVTVPAQYGAYNAAMTIEQARERFSFDVVEGVSVMPVQLRVWNEPEIWHGEPTGMMVWKAEAIRRAGGTGGYAQHMSVLGRATNAAGAVRDWNSRAAGDGLLVLGTVEALERKDVWSVIATFEGFEVSGPDVAGYAPYNYVSQHDSAEAAQAAADGYWAQEERARVLQQVRELVEAGKVTRADILAVLGD